MNHPQTDLQNFLLWFSELEEVPLTVRRDFLGHILKIGYLDEKAINFIQHSLDKIERDFQKNLSDLRQEITERSEELNRQKNPETSFLEQIYRSAEQKFKELVGGFKTDFLAYENEKLKKEKSAESVLDQAQISMLKKSVLV